MRRAARARSRVDRTAPARNVVSRPRCRARSPRRCPHAPLAASAGGGGARSLPRRGQGGVLRPGTPARRSVSAGRRRARPTAGGRPSGPDREKLRPHRPQAQGATTVPTARRSAGARARPRGCASARTFPLLSQAAHVARRSDRSRDSVSRSSPHSRVCHQASVCREGVSSSRRRSHPSASKTVRISRATPAKRPTMPLTKRTVPVQLNGR